MLHGRSQAAGGPFFTVACPHCGAPLVAEQLTAGHYAFSCLNGLPARSALAQALRRFRGMPPRPDRPGPPPAMEPKVDHHNGTRRVSSRTSPEPPLWNERFSPSLQVLGLTRHATLEDVKRRFRQLAKLHHPDRFARAAESEQRASHARFVAIREAYRRLVDGVG